MTENVCKLNQTVMFRLKDIQRPTVDINTQQTAAIINNQLTDESVFSTQAVSVFEVERKRIFTP